MSETCNKCCADLSNTSAAYRKALVAVIVLNLGMGAVEIVGSVIGQSQALKADSLDFLGDGLITLSGFLTLHSGPRARAKVALTQGVFLLSMGLFVIATAIYRFFVHQSPSAELMGALGAVALVVNLASAALLYRHRSGDANLRAIWLFSRNDAIGNLVVLVAAGLVALMRHGWPDLFAALLVAGLFLHSAVEIVKNARRELLPL